MHTIVELQTVSVAYIRTGESEVHVDYVSPVLCTDKRCAILPLRV